MGRRPEPISKSRSFFRGKVLNRRAFPREILGELPVSYRIRPLLSRGKPKSQGKNKKKENNKKEKKEEEANRKEAKRQEFPRHMPFAKCVG